MVIGNRKSYCRATVLFNTHSRGGPGGSWSADAGSRKQLLRTSLRMRGTLMRQVKPTPRFERRRWVLGLLQLEGALTHPRVGRGIVHNDQIQSFERVAALGNAADASLNPSLGTISDENNIQFYQHRPLLNMHNI